MLKKLLKYEWRDTRKLLLPMNLVIILITLIGCILLSTSIFDTSTGFLIAAPLLVLYLLAVIAFSFTTLIYIYVRFYKNLFTAEGYLMHTLPVTRTQLFHSKLIMGYFWFFLNSLLTALSTGALGAATGFHAATTEMVDEVNISFAEIFGCSPAVLLFWGLLTLIVSSLSSVLMGYVSVLLGQRMERNKLAAAVGFYFGIYMVIQIVSSLAMMLPIIIEVMTEVEGEVAGEGEVALNFMTPGELQLIFPSMSVFYLILCIVFYILCRVLINRKVNLD